MFRPATVGQSSVEQCSLRLVETAAPPLAIGLRHDRVLLNSTVTCSANRSVCGRFTSPGTIPSRC